MYERADVPLGIDNRDAVVQLSPRWRLDDDGAIDDDDDGDDDDGRRQWRRE